MKISSSRNTFDLLYLDILENFMENILSLNCGEECRSLTCLLQHLTFLNLYTSLYLRTFLNKEVSFVQIDYTKYERLHLYYTFFF